MKKLAVVFVLASVATVLTAQARQQSITSQLEDLWRGEEPYFRAYIRFDVAADTSVTAFLTGPTGEGGNQFTSAMVLGDSLVLRHDQMNVTFHGTIVPSRPEIRGTWQQGDRQAELTLVPASDMSEDTQKREQEPTEPYPYIVEETAFYNSSDSTRLSATLTVPRGPGPFAGVLLIPGSGPNDRDYSMNGHKPFLILADHLAKSGIASFRYDLRGVGDSSGNSMTATFADSKKDALAAFQALTADPRVDAESAGIIAHSAGTFFAPEVLKDSEYGAFLVLLMPPTQPGHATIVEQWGAMSEARGLRASEVDSVQASMRYVMDIVTSNESTPKVSEQLREYYRSVGIEGSQLDAFVRANSMPWWREFARHDPRESLQLIDVPSLVIFGGRDLFVDPAIHRPLAQELLSHLPNKQREVTVLPEINHWFQPSKTGLPEEIESNPVTVSEAVLHAIDEWIMANVSTEN